MASLAHVMDRLLGGDGTPDRGRPEGSLDPETPIGAAEYVVFDTELTGMKSRKNSIVSIGAVRIKGSRILAGEYFNRIVQPRTELTGQSIVIHGITPSEARMCPGIESALPEFLAFCRGDVLVGHMVSMDLQFVNNDMRRCYGTAITNPAVDTLALAAFLRKRERSKSAFHEEVERPLDLFSLATAYGIPVNRSHEAIYDAYVTAQLFQRYLAVLPKHGVRTLGELIKIGKP